MDQLSAEFTAWQRLGCSANATTTPDSDRLQTIFSLVVSAVDAVSAVQGRLSVNATTLERASATQTDYQDFASGPISDVKDVDIAAVAAQLSSYSRRHPMWHWLRSGRSTCSTI
jgi:flagellar hook-associated protein 3 FlgL